MEVCFAWSWSWVLPTPGSAGWKDATHTIGTSKDVDAALTADAHFCNQRPWGIEALGCTNNMQLFQTLEDEFCEKVSDPQRSPDPAALGRKKRYETYGCCSVSCFEEGDEDGGLTFAPHPPP